VSEQRNECPDCQCEMQPIKLLDATYPGFGDKGAGHVETAYAAADATAKGFTHSIPKAGTVKAKICPTCGRILLHGSSP